VELTELELMTSRLQEMKSFYTQSLELPLVEETDASFAVAAGRTRLRFVAASGQPFYHFAFNIPENKIERASAWLNQRVTLLREPGGEQVHIANWNAHSLYFYDPAGNVVEFIARHYLNNAAPGPFQPDDLLCVSEIGLPVDDVLETAENLQITLGLTAWRELSGQFARVGGEDGMLIVVPKGRIWFMTDKPAEAFPLSVRMRGSRPARVRVQRYTLDLHP